LSSGLLYVIFCFAFLAAVNTLTVILGPSHILSLLNAHVWGVLLSEIIFDSWGTTAGLFGLIILFTPILFGTPTSERVSLSMFFLSMSVLGGIGSAALWNMFYNTSGTIPSGASSIAFTGQAIIFALAVAGLIRLVRTRGQPNSSRNYFAVIYLTLIATTLWFIVDLQPVFIPSNFFNWRVHEFAFVFGLASTMAYSVIKGGAKLKRSVAPKPIMP
jgi:hypothetical protein